MKTAKFGDILARCAKCRLHGSPGAHSIITILSLIAALPLSASAHAAASSCSFGSQPTIIEKVDAGPDTILLQRWELDTDQILSQRALPDSTSLAAYRGMVEKRIATGPTALLRRYVSLQPAPADLHNIAIAATSPPENIKEMGCLEGLLLDIQLGRNQGFATDGPEFIAFVLRKQGRLRVYFLTNDSQGIRGAGFTHLLSRIDAD